MSPLLILIPTEFEFRTLRPLIEPSALAGGGILAVCGFGPIAAGIGTTRLLAEWKPRSVILCGIAGAMTSELPIGSATTFSQVACYGIGAGSGSTFQTAGELGWDQWNSSAGSKSFGDVISLNSNTDAQHGALRQLLTVCSASASANDVTMRRQKFPTAIAEDMEAYAVAMACSAATVPLTVIRGISNVAGDRDHSRWQVNMALHAAAELLLKVIK